MVIESFDYYADFTMDEEICMDIAIPDTMGWYAYCALERADPMSYRGSFKW